MYHKPYYIEKNASNKELMDVFEKAVDDNKKAFYDLILEGETADNYWEDMYFTLIITDNDNIIHTKHITLEEFFHSNDIEKASNELRNDSSLDLYNEFSRIVDETFEDGSANEVIDMFIDEINDELREILRQQRTP